MTAGTFVVAVTILPLSLSGVLSVQLGAELGLTSRGLGLVFATFFGTAALSSSRLGRLTERIGAERCLRAGGLLVALVCVVIAVGVGHWLHLVLALAVIGVGSALTRPATSLWIARAIPPSRQGLALGVNHTSVLVSTLLAGVAVPSLALTVGWRATYAAAAVLACLAVLLVPRERSVGVHANPPGPRHPEDLPRRLLVFLALVVAFGTAGASSLGAFTLPTMVAGGVSESAAGLIVAGSSVIGLLIRVGVGHLADRRSAVGLRGTAAMIGLGAIAFVMLASPLPPVVLAGVPLAFATAWGWLGLFNLAVIRLNPLAPGAATGITQSGAFVGGMVGPFGMGVIAEQVSYSAAWMFVALLALVSTVALALIERRVRVRYPPRPEAVVEGPVALPEHR